MSNHTTRDTSLLKEVLEVHQRLIQLEQRGVRAFLYTATPMDNSDREHCLANCTCRTPGEAMHMLLKEILPHLSDAENRLDTAGIRAGVERAFAENNFITVNDIRQMAAAVPSTSEAAKKIRELIESYERMTRRTNLNSFGHTVQEPLSFISPAIVGPNKLVIKGQ